VTTATADLRDVIKLIPGYDPEHPEFVFDEGAALRAIEFFAECLRHVKGHHAGQPLILEPWQQAVIACLFGWKRQDGTRRYRECLIYVPRKNGKTTLAAGIVLYMLSCDGEKGAEIYSSGADKEQAGLIFQQAVGMVQQEPLLASRLLVYKTTKSITYEATSSFYKALSHEVASKHGYNSHCIVNDELHAQPANSELIDVLMTSTGSRLQPLIVHITTADYEREGSICNAKHTYAQKVRDGIIDDPSFLPVIYETSKTANWKDPAVWARANPNLGVSLNLEYLERECKRAEESPSFENTFRRLHLNCRTEQQDRWLPLDSWEKSKKKMPRGLSKCYVGVDLSNTKDFSAAVFLFPTKGGAYYVLPYFWVPRARAAERERRDRIPYIRWARNKLIELTPGEVVNYDWIRRRIVNLSKRFKIEEIAIDPWNARQFAQKLKDEDGFQVVEFRQGYASLNEPSKELERLVMTKKMNHGGNEVLTWMVSNVAIDGDPAGNIKPSKKRSNEKIDGVVAMIMALGRAMLSTTFRSVYEKRGVRQL